MNKTRGLFFTAGIVLAMAFILSLMSCALSPVNEQLHDAAMYGNLEATEKAISQGANVNAKDWPGHTPISWAVYSQNIDVVKLLIEKGANVNQRRANGSTLLDGAVEKGNIDIVKLLVEKGANVNAKVKDGDKYSRGKLTTLTWATERGNIDIAKFLIESGADVNAKNIGGSTALYYAVAKNDISMVELLMENGATFDKNKYGSLEEYARFVQEKEQREEIAAREKAEQEKLKWEIARLQLQMQAEYEQTQNQSQSTEFDAGEFANAMTNLAIAANNLGKSNTQQPNQYQQNQYQNSQYQNTQQDNGNCQARYDRWTNQADRAASHVMKMDKGKSTYAASQKNLRDAQKEMRNLRNGSECRGKITKSWLEDAKPDAPVRSGSKYDGH